MSTGQQFSTLEVVNSDTIFKKSPPADAGKQVLEEDGIEAVDQPRHPPYSEKIPLFRNRRKQIWIIASILLLAVILAAVLGGVLGSKKPKQPDSHSPPSSTPSPSPITSSHSNFLQRKIAAISSNNNPNTTYLYYQDKNGTFIEGTLSSSSKTWEFDSIGSTKSNCTGMAAAASRPGFPGTITIVYTDDDLLIHDYIYNSTTKKWGPGTISDQKYVTHPNSGLAVLYNQCNYCSNNTIVVYQDVNGWIQAAKHTASGWEDPPVQINVKAIAGTALALQSQYKATPNKAGTLLNYADQINLFYQQDVLNISLASWKPADINNGVSGWVAEKQVYGRGYPGTPLAAAASSNNASSEPEWIQLLQLSDRGIGVNTWSHAAGGWRQPQVYTPSPMSNSTANIRSYGAVAMTALGNAYAVVSSSVESGDVSVESWSMNDDLTTWISTGTVIEWSD